MKIILLALAILMSSSIGIAAEHLPAIVNNYILHAGQDITLGNVHCEIFVTEFDLTGDGSTEVWVVGIEPLCNERLENPDSGIPKEKSSKRGIW